ncbi:hypothetical protein GCM10023088_11930 [Actinomadura verrucosospora]|uniref:hypothetical protein n=1 Tax=Actinomadura TaxID=1988 RepID=UPI0031F0F6CC
MWCGRWQGRKRDSGASAIEYASLVLVASAIIVGLLAMSIPNVVSPRTRGAICKVFQGDGCVSPEGGGGNGLHGGTGNPDGGTGQGTEGGNGGNGVDGGTGTDGGTGNGGNDSGGPGWNQAYTGLSPLQAVTQGFGDQVGNFFSGLGTGIKQLVWDGLGKAIVDDVTGLVDLVTDPGTIIDAGKYVFEHPWDALRQMVVDDETVDMWKDGNYLGATGRTIWNVGSWAIPYYDVGKGIGKIGKLGRLGRAASKLGKAGKLAEESAGAAERAGKAAKSGDLVGARKAADEAKRKADDAKRAAGCKPGALGPPRGGSFTAPAGALTLPVLRGARGLAVQVRAAAPTPCEKADASKTRVDQALREAALKKIAQLRNAGPGAHGVQRHLDPPDDRIRLRLGEPKYNPDGTPQLYGPTSNYQGYVKGDNATKVDPMNPNPRRPDGTLDNTDAITGGTHKVGPFSTKFSDPLDFALAEGAARAKLTTFPPSGTQAVELSINDLPAGAASRMKGWYRNAADPTQFKAINFQNATIRAIYKLDANGKPYLYTMYPDPVKALNPP